MNKTECAEKIIDFLSEQTKLEDLPKADLLFVFGSTNPNVPKYLTKLVPELDVEYILISGGIGTRGNRPGEYNSEAEFFKSFLVEASINTDNVILEKKASNTLENVIFGMKLIEENGIDVKTVIITGYPGLLKRARATLSKNYPDLEIYAHSFLPIDKDLSDFAVQERLAGEIDRLEQYYEKGDISKVEIPEEILKCRDTIYSQ